MNERSNSVIKTVPAASALHSVPMFDPLKLLRMTTSAKTGEKVLRLDLSYKKMWFLLVHPRGRMLTNILRITDQMAIFEAQLYADRGDNTVLAQFTSCHTRKESGPQYIRNAQDEALNKALDNAGFGIQLSDLVEHDDNGYGSEVLLSQVEALLREPEQVRYTEQTAPVLTGQPAPTQTAAAQTMSDVQEQAQAPIPQREKSTPVQKASAAPAAKPVETTAPVVAAEPPEGDTTSDAETFVNTPKAQEEASCEPSEELRTNVPAYSASTETASVLQMLGGIPSAVRDPGSEPAEKPKLEAQPTVVAFPQAEGSGQAAQDMDKYSNQGVSVGASKVYLLAKKHGMACRRLTWNPNYKGIDDWLLALRQREKSMKECENVNFKERYLSGECTLDDLDDYVARWHEEQDDGVDLHEYLGFTHDEYNALLQIELTCKFEDLMEAQRRRQRYRVYQLDLSGIKTVPFAFRGIDQLHKAGYQQPPAADYQLIYDGEICCPLGQEENTVLERVFRLCNDSFPVGYAGHSLSPSDVVELYSGDGRRYFYRDTNGFVSVQFSPMLAKRDSKLGNAAGEQ